MTNNKKTEVMNVPTLEEIKAKYNTGDNLDEVKVRGLIDDLGGLIVATGQGGSPKIGRGIPNSRVTGKPGDLYIDEIKTLGASVWVKTDTTSNAGWEVLSGDTGKKQITVKNALNGKNAAVFVRRNGRQVTITFGAGQYGWFSLDLNALKNDGWAFSQRGQDVWIKLVPKSANGNRNDFIPQGFRSETGMVAGVYDDNTRLIGSVYYGGDADSNALMIRFPNITKENITQKMLQEMRIGFFTYITSDQWPMTEPN